MIAESFDEMQNMTERENITAEDMEEIRDTIEELVNHVSWIGYVFGFFTFVNIIWCIAICGMTCTVGPCLYVCLGPIIRRIGTCFFTFMKSVIVWIV